MNWLFNLETTHPVASAVLVLALVAIFGLALGNVRIGGVELGIAGVLFSGILFGHFGFRLDPTILEFSRDFGLVLFVYTIGIQVGPGFFTSLRHQGLSLNLLALAVIGLGALLALSIGSLMHFPIAVVVGLLSGATTNTPSLGAAQEAVKSMPGIGPAELTLPALAYAAAYPFGIVGIITAILLIRLLFRINPQQEAATFFSRRGQATREIRRLSIEFQNEAWSGRCIREITALQDLHVVITRYWRPLKNKVATASSETILFPGDILLAVGEKENLDRFCLLAGKSAAIDLMTLESEIQFQDITVTNAKVIGQSLRHLDFANYHGVAISRITRDKKEMSTLPGFSLQFGDRIRVVGTPDRIKEAAQMLGNSEDMLSHTHFIPVFIGIALGVFVGSFPIQILNMPAPLTLGLAGGPLIVAILLSRLRRIGPLVWYMPVSANLALRELGIILFLDCVGLKAGSHFFEILLHGDGLLWMACAAVITLVPLLAVGIVARIFLKLNFMDICGLLTGTMTDPPALAFANNLSHSDAPAIAYATVYPLTMLLRIIIAQVLILTFHG